MKTKLLLLMFIPLNLFGVILIPMDYTQTDHLKAYGVVYNALLNGYKCEWLLNYRGGSFVIPDSKDNRDYATSKGVRFEIKNTNQMSAIYDTIQNSNMEVVHLDKAPKIAIYSPHRPEMWDDAVMLALNYAEIPYDIVYDTEILSGKLKDIDWLHLHHEDFTGQFGKFYASYRNERWYIENVKFQTELAHSLGFQKVWQLKHVVVDSIAAFVKRGGFLFAMCSATDSYDIARAYNGKDIVDVPFDGDPPDMVAVNHPDYKRTFAFKDFKIITSPYVYEFSDIDMTNMVAKRGEKAYFYLFDFSAKMDPISSMLTQNHTKRIKEFMGQTTAFNRQLIKENVVILADVPGTDEVKYIHGEYGKGTFTFLGGHDPEDYRHFIGDPPTDLSLYKHSPGYRLILNNVLFPASRKKKHKT